MSDTNRCVCSNCREAIEREHDGHGGPLCPKCNVQEMTQMRTPECGECESTVFRIYDPSRQSNRKAEPQIECIACGWTGRVDSDGVWY
jgi:hypothetical protein